MIVGRLGVYLRCSNTSMQRRDGAKWIYFQESLGGQGNGQAVGNAIGFEIRLSTARANGLYSFLTIGKGKQVLLVDVFSKCIGA